jgi:hypothetical protein
MAMSKLPTPGSGWSELQPASATAKAAHVSVAELANRVNGIPVSPYEVFARAASQSARRSLRLLGGLQKEVCSTHEQTLDGLVYFGTFQKIKP